MSGKRGRKVVTVTITLEIEEPRNADADAISVVESILDDGDLQASINAYGLKVISAVQS